MKILLIISVVVFFCLNVNAAPKELSYKFSDAYVTFKKGTLVVGNAKIERKWQWTGKGFVTTSLKNNETRKVWTTEHAKYDADWQIPGFPEEVDGEIIDIKAQKSDDEKFTSYHIEVAVEIFYPKASSHVKFLVWVYPNSTGIRTQLLLKTDGKMYKPGLANTGIKLSAQNILSCSSYSNGNTPDLMFDENAKTCWSSKVSESKPVTPNFIILDLHENKEVNGVAITQKNDYMKLGWIEKCLIYATSDTLNWGLPVGVGNLSRAEYQQYIAIKPQKIRYLKLVIPSTTPLNYPLWQTSIGELNVFTGQEPYKSINEGRADYLPIKCSNYSRTYIGYNADQQFRNSLEYPFLREEIYNLPIVGHEITDWNNITVFENEKEGVAFVKESNKTALQRAHFTGAFICSDDGIEITGLGLDLSEYSKEYNKCWANWTIVYSGTAEDRILAIKQFDRSRFPFTLPGHKTLYANSWGNGLSAEASWREKMDGALENNVIDAIKAASEMGIEAYQIDCGWSEDPFTPDQKFPFGHRPHPVYYPNGWENVKKIANENNVKLALWTDVGITIEDLNWNQQNGNFISWKWDFANFINFKSRNDIEIKARNFIRKSNYNLSLNWDLTESFPRYGFFWGREYGIIFLTNREPSRHILYTPSVALRDTWDLAKYINTNKFQITVRNVKNIDPPSDASLHSQEYATAISLVGIPMFFEKLVSYDELDRKRIKSLLEIYKKERDEMFDSFVFPVGDRPDNSSFTGFQFYNPNSNSGHLMLFRELYSTQKRKEIKLSFLKNKQLKVTNLIDQSNFMINTDKDGYASFGIETPASFLFYCLTIQ